MDVLQQAQPSPCPDQAPPPPPPPPAAEAVLRSGDPHAVADLFAQWLGMPHVGGVVDRVLADATAAAASPPSSPPPHDPRVQRRARQSGLPPPSPPRTPSRGGDARHGPAPLRLGAAARGGQVAQFYFPDGRPLDERAWAEAEAVVRRVFGPSGEVGAPGVRRLATEVCGLSSYVSTSLARRLDPDETGSVRLDAFLAFWRTHIARHDEPARLFHVLRADDGATHLRREDLRLLLHEVVDTHPGLEFLDSTPEFQFRYVQTVIARVFYSVNRSGTDRLTLGELRRSNLCATLRMLDDEDDINKINDFFSYEHFYVIYCKFWELDTNHDFLIDANDLRRYDSYSLSSAVIDRVVSGAARPLLGQDTPGVMGYEDFIFFFISEVHKDSDVAIDYWFRCVDLDADGRISVFEMEPFLDEQRQRLQAFGHDPIRLDDVLCQVTDMIRPRAEGVFSRRDLRRSQMATPFFNLLFNMRKYMLAEQRDPYIVQQVRDTPELTPWDRFAISEYYRLAEADDAAEEIAKAADMDGLVLAAGADEHQVPGGGVDVGGGGAAAIAAAMAAAAAAAAAATSRGGDGDGDGGGSGGSRNGAAAGGAMLGLHAAAADEMVPAMMDMRQAAAGGGGGGGGGLSGIFGQRRAGHAGEGAAVAAAAAAAVSARGGGGRSPFGAAGLGALDGGGSDFSRLVDGLGHAHISGGAWSLARGGVADGDGGVGAIDTDEDDEDADRGVDGGDGNDGDDDDVEEDDDDEEDDDGDEDSDLRAGGGALVRGEEDGDEEDDDDAAGEPVEVVHLA